jgi:hypothetical protein
MSPVRVTRRFLDLLLAHPRRNFPARPAPTSAMHSAPRAASFELHGGEPVIDASQSSARPSSARRDLYGGGRNPRPYRNHPRLGYLSSRSLDRKQITHCIARSSLGSKEWVNASCARSPAPALTRSKLRPCQGTLGVSRWSFYWHFSLTWAPSTPLCCDVGTRPRFCLAQRYRITFHWKPSTVAL